MQSPKRYGGETEAQRGAGVQGQAVSLSSVLMSVALFTGPTPVRLCQGRGDTGDTGRQKGRPVHAWGRVLQADAAACVRAPRQQPSHGRK